MDVVNLVLDSNLSRFQPLDVPADVGFDRFQVGFSCSVFMRSRNVQRPSPSSSTACYAHARDCHYDDGLPRRMPVMFQGTSLQRRFTVRPNGHLAYYLVRRLPRFILHYGRGFLLQPYRNCRNGSECDYRNCKNQRQRRWCRFDIVR